MNGKFKHSTSLEGELAAVAVAVNIEVQDRINSAGFPEIPGVSDFEKAFRIHCQIRDLKIRLEERDRLEKGGAKRRSELVKQLYQLEAERNRQGFKS